MDEFPLDKDQAVPDEIPEEPDASEEDALDIVPEEAFPVRYKIPRDEDDDDSA
jgi:hypothetical protein